MKKKILLLFIITTSCVYNNGGSTQIDYYNSENTKKLDFPFSDATIVNNVIYVAGQVGNIPGTNEIVLGGIKEETKQTMKNIESVLLKLGSSKCEKLSAVLFFGILILIGYTSVGITIYEVINGLD